MRTHFPFHDSDCNVLLRLTFFIVRMHTMASRLIFVHTHTIASGLIIVRMHTMASRLLNAPS